MPDKPFDALECLEDMKTGRIVLGDSDTRVEDFHARIDKIIATITADRKRIETLNIEANLQHHGEKQLNLQLQVATKRIAAQAATIERLRGALEPFAIPFDTVNIPEAYGVFLGGLIKNNFIVARQALKEG